MSSNHLFVSAICAALVVSSSLASGGTIFHTGFDSPPLHPGLQDADAAFTLSGGAVQRTSSAGPTDRRYIRTSDSDYFATGDFEFEVSFTNPFGSIQFIGLGTGARNPSFANEPGPASGGPGSGTGAVNLRIHSPDIVGGRVDWAFNIGIVGEQVLVTSIGILNNVGLHRARVSVLNDFLTLAIDQNYTGIFSPTISTTVDLGVHPTIKAALLNESRAFFGTAQTGLAYDNFRIVPEPASLGLLVLIASRFFWWRGQCCAKRSS